MEQLVRTFFNTYAHQPDGVWAAPGRVNLIGEHTDYNGGFVLPFALPHRTMVAAARIDEQRWTVHSTNTGETVSFGPPTLDEPVPGWAAYVAGVIWALRDAGHDVPGALMTLVSDVPQGAGLSSSAALECAVLTALNDLGELDIPVDERPGIAQRAENAYVGMPCGILDQSASVLCRDGHALFMDCADLTSEQIPLDLPAAGLAVLVIDTRAPHRLVDGEYAARRAACEKAAKLLRLPSLRHATLSDLVRVGDELLRRRARHVITENQRVLDTIALLGDGKPEEIGPLMTASHVSLRDDFEVTVPELDTAVEAALAAGAYGARMTGGGFGGCVIALVRADATARVTSAVEHDFATAGFAAPATFIATPSPGAARIA